MVDAPSPEIDPTAALEEDEPLPLDTSLPPEIASPLAPFKGEEPASPPWFKAALARQPERSFVSVLGARIELLTWGERGKPGLIFVHGNSAHADWWSFIAPFFADDYRVAALSLSGMGLSDWRDSYSFETFSEEIHECAKAAGLYEAAEKPVYIGHSFGGGQVFYSTSHHPERMKASILVDTGFGGPPTQEEVDRWEKEEIARGGKPGRFSAPRHRTGPNKVYPTLPAALARFRFMPPQVPGNLYIADYIARLSVKPAPEGDGWTWRFDPGIWGKLDRTGMMTPAASAATPPMVHIYGDQSAIIRNMEAMGRGLHMIPASVPRIVIPDSEHHIKVDQPLALVAALRTDWRSGPAPPDAAGAIDLEAHRRLV